MTARWEIRARRAAISNGWPTDQDLSATPGVLVRLLLVLLIAVMSFAWPVLARADVITEWNLKTAQFTVAGRLAPPDAWDVLATTGVSTADALAAISGKFPALLAKLK